MASTVCECFSELRMQFLRDIVHARFAPLLVVFCSESMPCRHKGILASVADQNWQRLMKNISLPDKFARANAEIFRSYLSPQRFELALTEVPFAIVDIHMLRCNACSS